MRALIFAGLTGLSLVSLAACGKPAAPSAGGAAAPAAGGPARGPISLQDLPHRKSGLWRQTMTIEGVNQPMPSTDACSDAASEAKLSLLGQHKSRDLCQNQQFTRNPDGSLSFAVSCNKGERGVTTSSGTISGDFNSSYRIVMDSKTTGAPIPQMNAERKMTIQAVWIGPCAPGMRGGDVLLPGGRKFNLTDPAPEPPR